MTEVDRTVLENVRSEVKRPRDFVDFWQDVKDDLAVVPIAWDRISRPDAGIPGYRVDWIRFASMADQPIYGWLAVPEKSAPNAGFLWLPGYSLGNPKPSPESLYPGVVTLGLNVHGNTPDTPYIHPSKQNADYIVDGIENPRTYIFRRIVAHCLRALAVLADQPEVDPDRVGVAGMSQGGGLALITAALAGEDAARWCFADMPWLCDLDRALSLIDRSRYRGARIPDSRVMIEDLAKARPDIAERIYGTYRYIDPLSHASDIQCPVQMSAGGRDPSCRPATIYAVFNELRCPKKMLFLPTTGHMIVRAMHAQHERGLRDQGILTAE